MRHATANQTASQTGSGSIIADVASEVDRKTHSFSPAPKDHIGARCNLAIKEFLKAKQFSNRRPSYIKSLKEYLKLFFAGRENWAVADFKSLDIELWFESRNEAPSTRASNVGRLSSFFRFSLRRGYHSINPCDALDTIRLERGTPKVLQPDQCRRLLHFLIEQRSRFLLWTVCALLIGIRPDESTQLNFSELPSYLEDNFIIVESSASKMRRRRIVEISDQARQWINFALKIGSSLPLPRSYVRKSIQRCCRALGFDRWPQDILRHSALSYQVAICKDEARVAMNAGNSVRVLRAHYVGVVTPKMCEEFQTILPPAGHRQLLLDLWPNGSHISPLSIRKR
jgi:integrase